METEKPKCKLIGKDGNVFSIIGSVCRTLKNGKLPEQAEEFSKRALKAMSYEEVLTLCSEYVSIF